jgi:RNA polymerase sigma factor (TIGR02999 family)
MSDVTLILQAVQQDQRLLSEQLLPIIYEELRRLAAAKMAGQAAGQTLQPTALVHEAWLRLVGDQDRNWQNRAHFFGAAACAMRSILVDRARRKASLKGGGGFQRVEIEGLELPAATPDEQVLLIHESLDELEREDPDSARIVMLKFFAGLSNEDLARTLGVNERTVRRHWTYAQAKLLRIICQATQNVLPKM